MSGYYKTLTKTLAAASANNIALSQSGSGAGNFTINGSAATGGVATLDTPRRVLITSAGTDTGITFTVTGTGQNGLAQSETITGGSSGNPVATTKDFGTVTQVSRSGSTASTITIGTNSTGSTAPMIVDRYINPNLLSVATQVTGSVTYSLEQSYDDLIPTWDINSNTTTWYGSSGFTGLTENQFGNITGGPFTMLRLTVTAGTGTAKAQILTPLIGGAI